MTESAPSTRPTWTDEQALALHAIRAAFRQSKIPFGDAQSAAERAVIPSNLPEGLFITSTMVPPSLDIPASILQNPVVHPAETPLFFYTTSAEPPSLGGMPARGTKVIFFVHGGGNVTGHPTGQGTLPFLSDLVRKLVAGISARALIAAPSFRLATVPENCFPAALQDLYSAYSYLIKEGYDAKDVTIAGESGGGNLALILTYLISQSSPHALPDHVVTIAPAADLTHTLSDFAKAQADADLLSIASYEAASSQYLAAFPANDPLASSTFINFPPSWPKTLIMVGTADQLIDASRTIAKKIEEAGNTVKLIEFDDLPHGWWLFPSIFNQINDAIDKIVQFVQS